MNNTIKGTDFRFTLFLAMVLTFVLINVSHAIQIDKYRIILKRRDTLVVGNTSSYPINVKVDIEGEEQCREVRVFPRIFSLLPGQTQTVKLLYRGADKFQCRLYVLSERDASPETADGNEDSRINTSVSLRFRVGIPLLVNQERSE